MPLSDTLDIFLTALTYGGDALGRLPDGDARAGLAVFVPYALPGEKVRVRLVEEKRGHARAELLEVLEPSPDRIVPRCPHYFSIRNPQSAIRIPPCGGCHYQHLSYEAQLAAKTTILRDQLERIGGLTNPPVALTVPSPTPWNYRNHIQFHLTSEGKLGFESPRSNIVIPIDECHLPELTLNEIWPQLDIEVFPGLERVSLRLGADDEVLLVLETDGSEPVDFTVEELSISAVQLGPGGALVLAGSNYMTIEVGITPADQSGNPPTRAEPPCQRLFQVSAGSFFQVNTRMAAKMVEHLLAYLPLSPATTLLEVYCGVGLFSAFLAPHVGRLIGIEVSPSACEDFAINLDEFDHVELYEAAAEDVLPALDIRAEHAPVVVVDPPRAGLDRRVLEGLLNLGASTIAYISCDPSTLARDARRLVAGGYTLERITPFDLFPQTYHIESISFWRRQTAH